MKKKRISLKVAWLICMMMGLFTSLSLKSQNDCQTATVLTAPSASIAVGDTHTKWWYAFTPTAGQEGVYTVLRTDWGMNIEIYSGTCNNLNQLGYVNYIKRFYAEEGETYYFYVNNYNTSPQTWSLTKETNTEGMTCETAVNVVESASIDADLQGDNWYVFTPSQNGVYMATINEEYVSFEVYEGSSCNNMHYIRGGRELIAFSVRAGQTYYFTYENSSDTTQTWSLQQAADPTGLLCETARSVTPAANIPTYTAGENWYSFTATQAGVYTATGDNINISVFGDCDGGYNDNNSFYVGIGETYYIRASNYYATLGTWSLVLETNPVGLACQTAIPVAPATSITSLNYTWYEFTPTAAQEGVYAIMEEEGWMYSVRLHEGSCYDNNYKYISAGLPFYAQAGVSYYFTIMVSDGDTTIWSLEPVTNPENIFCQAAETIVPSTNTTTESYDRWYVFSPTAAEEGVYGFVSSHSDYYTYLYKGSCNNLIEVAANGYFYAKQGETYYAELSNYSSAPLVWSIEKEANPEALICETAKAITSPQTDITIDMGNKTDGMYWYAFTPAKTAVYTASSCGKGGSAELGIWGGSCDDPIYIAPSGYCNGDEETYATFNAQAGTTYLILWDVYDAVLDNSTYSFTWDLIEETGNTEGMICEDAIITTGGTNIAAQRSLTWYRFTPTASNHYSIYCSGANSEDAFGVVVGDCSIEEEDMIAYFGDTDTSSFYAEAGTTYYICCMHYGGAATFYWNLVVNANPQYALAVELDYSTVVLDINEEEEIWAEASDGGVYNNAVWTSRNPAIATVTPVMTAWDGGQFSIATLTGKSAGQTYIVFSATAGTETLTDSCLVTVNGAQVHVTGVSIKQSTTILVNNTEQLSATVTPSNATNKGVLWTSLAPSIATVTAAGLVTAKADGETYIVVTTVDGGFKDSCLVHVSSTVVNVTDVSLNKTQLNLHVGNSETLIASITPNTATNQNVSWESDNDAVATVNPASGMVTAVGVGSTVITVTTQDGNHEATCTVHVSATGIREVAAQVAVTIYPNPVQNTLHIESVSAIERVIIYDISGRMLKQIANPNQEIPVNDLANGIYLVKVKTLAGEVIRKIVKE